MASSGRGGSQVDNVGNANAEATVVRERGTFIFHGDGRALEAVFAEGLQPRGANQDLFRYALENEPSIFMPTSKLHTIAREFAEMQGGGYVYTIRRQANGVDVHAVLGARNLFPSELEIAVPGGKSHLTSWALVKSRQVESWRAIPGKRLVGLTMTFG